MLHERNEGRAREESLLAAEVARAAAPATAARQIANTAACLAVIQRDLGRARELLQEAQRMAGAVVPRIHIGSIETGLGILALWDGDADAAREHLSRGLELVRRERDRYYECKCLMYLTRLELEQERPERALVYCNELMPVASRMGEGNEGPFAAALQALAERALGSPEADTRLNEALDALDQVDAQAARAYALNAAALLDVRAGCFSSAHARAEHALEAARRVGRKTEVALARVVLSEVARCTGDGPAARAHVETVLANVSDPDALDARTYRALKRITEELGIRLETVQLLEN
jgi:hypothetical protein